MSTMIIAFASVMLSVAAQFTLKTGISGNKINTVIKQPLSQKTIFTILTDKYVISGFILYGVGAIVWLWVLSRWEVSKAYPLVGIGFLLTAIIGFMVGENLTIMRIAGIICISLGVWMISST